MDDATAGVAVVALAIFAHGWQSRIVAPPAVLSIIGWVVNALAVVALVRVWFD